MIIMLLADGFEEIEALTPVDMLRRAGLDIKTVSVIGRNPVGAHGIEIKCDSSPEKIDLSQVEMAIFPGGMPGATNLDSCPFTDEVINSLNGRGGYLAAICAAPLILGRRGLLNGKSATCYPGFENELSGATILDESVVRDGNIITARGMGVALEFAEEIIKALSDEETARKISSAICKVGCPTVEKKEEKDYSLPSTSLFTKKPDIDEPNEDEVEKAKRIIEELFKEYSIKASVTKAHVGAQIMQFDVVPEKGEKVSKIINIRDDISLALAVGPVRIVAPVPGQGVIGIEVPKKKIAPVALGSLIDTEDFRSSASPLTVCLGTNVYNEPVYADVAKMPHLLISGATGMGKSISMFNIITSILYKAKPDEVKFILIDPKMVEFVICKDIPSLFLPIIHDAADAVAALDWACDEMERRYELFLKHGVRNVETYNIKAEGSDMKLLERIVIVIDELADLMFVKKNETEAAIMRIAQKARATGIHLIIGTQRPTSSVISPLIKANIPSRLCFKVISHKDSITVLDTDGGEALIGRGDALIKTPGTYLPERIQSAYISENEVTLIATEIKKTNGEAKYDNTILDAIIKKAEEIRNPKRRSAKKSVDCEAPEDYLQNETFVAAVEVGLEIGKISTSLIQRKTSIGYGKAATFLDVMEEMGIVSKLDGSKPRTMLISKEDWEKMLSNSKK